MVFLAVYKRLCPHEAANNFTLYFNKFIYFKLSFIHYATLRMQFHKMFKQATNLSNIQSVN